MSRRLIVPILLILTLVTPFVLRLAMGVSSSSSTDAHAVPLIIITSHAEGIRREMADAFREWHRKKYGSDVAMDYIAYGSEDLRRYLNDKNELYSPTHATLDVDPGLGRGRLSVRPATQKRRCAAAGNHCPGHHGSGVSISDAEWFAAV